MGELIKFRHNAMAVANISAFENIKGGFNNNCKDVYFVRAIGTDAAYIKDIQKMDDTLMSRMNEQKGFYHRMNELPKLQNIDDSTFYAGCYANWLDSNRKLVKTKATQNNEMLAGMLGFACATVEGMFTQGSHQVSESMVKNFIVKLLFWYDSIFANDRYKWDEKQSVKIVGANVGKKQEYLFYYLVTLMGCDVLLLQSKGDIDEAEEKLGLSTKFVLGQHADIVMPEYQWRATVPVRQRSQTPSQSTRSTTPAMGASGSNSATNTTSGSGRPVVQIPRRERPGRQTSQPSVSPAPQPSVTQARPVNTGATNNDAVEKSFEELAQLASSIVLIEIYDNKGERMGSGSGIMIGRDGYILTNNHVACGGKYYIVRIEDDDREYRTDEVIKYNSLLDLAVIRIQRTLKPLPIYKGKKPLVRGQKVVAIGSPLGLFNSVSDGIISGFRQIDNVDMIQFTAPTSRGSSGGAVLNMQGEVIGISTAGIDSGQNINLAMGYECINMFVQGFV